MEELETIKINQQRCKEKYVKSKSAGVVSSFVPGDIQPQNQKKMVEEFGRIEKILERETRTRKDEKKLDYLEQYGRRNCLILYGYRNVLTKGSYTDFETLQ